MQNLYPLFEKNRILKKELLWSLRDYSFAHLQLEYQEYGQGILRGCDIYVEGDKLRVRPGIIKCGRFICLMMEEESIQYKPEEQIQILKMNIKKDMSSPDYIAYQGCLTLETDEGQCKDMAEEETYHFELCRFNLRSGAQLRAEYKSFTDMETEYDTINLIYADWGGLGGDSMSPVITRRLAEAILNSENSCSEDLSFAWLCMSQAGAVPGTVLSDYIRRKSGITATSENGRYAYFKAMCDIVDGLRKGNGNRGKEVKERRRILVD